MKVFYDSRQNVAVNDSNSPSAGKPIKVVESWKSIVPVEIMPVDLVDKNLIQLAHEPDFVEGVLSCRLKNGFSNKLPTIAESLPWTNGSFVSAARYALENKTQTVSPTSGFHHAGYSTAEGFCTFNGLMIAAMALKYTHRDIRVAIADIDMHYGNGTDDIIERLNIDWINHYTFGNDNVYDGNEWLGRLPVIMESILAGTDMLFYQAGADPHVNDPYGGILTTDHLKERDRIVFTAAKTRNIPVVWNLAGGYQADFSKVLEIHDNTALMHVEIFGN